MSEVGDRSSPRRRAEDRQDVLLDALLTDVGAMRGELSTGLATLGGRLDTAVATMVGEHARLQEQVRTEKHARESLEAVVHGVIDRLDAYPRPIEVAKTAQLAERNQLTLVKLVAGMLAAGASGATFVELIRSVVIG